MLCVTGLPLIFAEEIDHWLDPHPPLESVAPGTPAPTLQSLVDRALAARPKGYVSDYIFFPTDEAETVVVQTATIHDPPPRSSYFYKFDRRTGKLLGEEPSTTSGFMYVMTRLHVDLFAGQTGMLFLGGMGLLLIVALVSGTVVYAPFMRKLDFGTVRRERPRAKWLDLHNLLGVVTLAWLFVVGFTGAINTLAQPVERQWQATELADMLAAYKDRPPPRHIIPVDAALATARIVAPDKKAVSVFNPNTAFTGSHHYTVFFVGNTPLTSRILSPAMIDAETAKLTDMRDMPWYAQALFLSQPLHFGDYGGMPLKIIWAILTIASIIVLGSGLYLFLRKSHLAAARADRTKPAEALG
jgi:uncharacterized iron-regulated membrane protein